MVQRGQARGDFVFLPFNTALERGMNVWSGIVHFRQSHPAFPPTKCVAGMGILELDDRSNVTRTEGWNTGPRFPVQLVDLADLFRAAPSCVVKFAPELLRPGINAEKR